MMLAVIRGRGLELVLPFLKSLKLNERHLDRVQLPQRFSCHKGADPTVVSYECLGDPATDFSTSEG